MVLLDAIYINNSGGKVLLDILVEKLHESNSEVFYLLDKRCEGQYNFLPKENTYIIDASLKSRHLFYKKNKYKFSKVLCFGNIPPSIKLNVPVYTYFHNLLLIEQPSNYPLKGKISKKLKGLLIYFLRENTTKFIVQSDNVKQSLIKYLAISQDDCLTLPFYKELNCNTSFFDKKEEFVYVSNGNSHKNHSTLLTAWAQLFEEGVNLPLHLTITREYEDLLLTIEKYKSMGMNITNHSYIDVTTLYSKCKYLIYPSLIESFGLGLIEAIDCNTEVIAADLPYVDAVIEPLKKFEPLSSSSIATAVKEVIHLHSDNLYSRKKVNNKINELIKLLSD